MLFEKDVYSYLNNEKFIGSLHVKISTSKWRSPSRIEFLKNLSKDKQIIHLGCADHIPLIDNKIKLNIWLHKLLLDKAKRCLGVDVIPEAIEYIKKLGYDDVLCLNIMKDEPSNIIKSQHWDYIIMGEILEHIDDPVFFLSEIRKKYNTDIDRIVITVPNGLRWINFKNVLKGRESINSDHRYWFTPYTLAKICTIAGFEVESFCFTLDYKLFKFSTFTRFLYKMYPAFLDNLCMIIKFKSDNHNIT